MKDLAFVCRVLGLFDGWGADWSELFWRTDREYAPVTFFANCNDLFSWGCADSEEITPSNVVELERAVADCRAAGGEQSVAHAVALFCARLRRMRPQGVCYDGVAPAVAALFDACGPPRATGLGNPRPHPSERATAAAENV